MNNTNRELFNEICVEVEALAFRGELTLDVFNARLKDAIALGADGADLLPLYRTASGEKIIRLSDYYRVQGPVGRNVTPPR